MQQLVHPTSACGCAGAGGTGRPLPDVLARLLVPLLRAELGADAVLLVSVPEAPSALSLLAGARVQGVCACLRGEAEAWLAQDHIKASADQAHVDGRIRRALADAAGFDAGIADRALVMQARLAGSAGRTVYLAATAAANFAGALDAGMQRLAAEPRLVHDALETAQAVLDSQEHARALLSTLDLLRVPVAIVRGDGSPMFANRALGALIRPQAPGASPGDVRERVAQTLRVIARNAVRRLAEAKDSRRMVTLWLEHGEQGGRTPLFVAPLPGRSGTGYDSALMLVCSGQTQSRARQPSLDGLGLTAAEARIAAFALAGRSPKDAAVACGITEASARTYLKRIYAKLGVSRQAELVASLSGFVAPLECD